MQKRLHRSGCYLARMMISTAPTLPWPCSACGGIARPLQHLPGAARWSYSGSCAAATAACRKRWAMAETWKRESLVTLPVSNGERRVIKVAAAARGMTVAGWLRSLLRAELVDLQK